MFFLLLTSGNSDIKNIFHQENSKKKKKKAKKKITSTPEPFLAKTTALSRNGKLLLEKWLKTLANI